MAYQIKKTGRIVEELELLAEDDSVAMSIHVDIDVDRIARDYRTTMMELTEAHKAAQSGTEDALDAYGKAIVRSYNLIFGESNTLLLLEYFDGRYTDMVAQTIPFFYDVVEPAVQRAVADKRKIISNNLGLSRSQRRRLGL